MRRFPQMKSLLAALPLVFVACANERMPFEDAGGEDGGSGIDVRDVPRIDVRDVPRMDIQDVQRVDTGRDVGFPQDIPRVDTGPMSGQCPPTCNQTIDCLNSCESAPAGFEYCCAFNSCTAVQAGTCAGAGDGGTNPGTDSGFPFPFPDAGGLGCLASPCTSNADCCPDAPTCLPFINFCAPL
jgi:hypothetical protein